MTQDALAEELLALGREQGLAAVGIATAEPFAETRVHLRRRKAAGLHGGMNFTYRNPERSTDPSRLLPGARSIVVGALSYRRSSPPATDAGNLRDPVARVARYSWRDHYAPLRDALSVLAGHVESAGWRAAVSCDESSLVDRAAAQRAGLGWFGKNTMLLLPGQGSWHVLGSVVTDAPLPASAAQAPPPADPAVGGCGTCSRCLDACPTGALVAPGVLDARRCLAWLLQAPGPFPTEHRAALGDRLYGCDACQEICPPNRTTDRHDPPPPAVTGDEAQVGILALLAADDATLLARFGRWYIPGRDPRHLRRNALVVLGNVADGADPAVEAALARALRDPDPLLRGHAVWAAARLGRRDLLAGPAGGEEDPTVIEELDAARMPAVPAGVAVPAGAGARPPAGACEPAGAAG